MSDDDDEPSEAEGREAGYVPVAQALEQSGFTLAQLRALVGAGIIKTKLAQYGGAKLYCVEDLQRFDGMPRAAEVEPPSQLVAEFNAVTAGYRQMLDLALKQTKQAQDHERLLVTAFSKPLNDLGESSKSLVTAVLDQNKQLVQRANDGDRARLEFVQGAETMLRDQRTELREQAELDRKHDMRREVWEGVKKAAPHLLDGLKATGSDQLKAAVKLKEKLDINKVASLVAFKLLDPEEIDLMCQAFGYDRAEIDRLAGVAVEVAEQADADDAAAKVAAE